MDDLEPGTESTDLADLLGDEEFEELVRRMAESGLTEEQIGDLVGNAIQTAIKEAAPELTKDLLRRMPKMLQQHEKDRLAFERRLKRLWGKAFDLYEAVLVGCTEAGSDFNENERPGAMRDQDLVFEALTLLHARACLTAAEVLNSLRGGFPDAAYARWRTLHELAVSAYVIVDGGQEVAERYLLHAYVEDAKDAQHFQRHAERLGYEAMEDAEVTELTQSVEQLVKRFGKEYRDQYGWAAPLFPGKRKLWFSDLETKVELAHLRPHYRLASHKTHGGSKGAGLGRVKVSGGIVLAAGPTNAGFGEVGHGSLISLSQLTTTLLIRGRKTGIRDPMRVVVCRSLLELVGKAGHECQRIDLKVQERWTAALEGSAQGFPDDLV
jgi:hypothetical protein